MAASRCSTTVPNTRTLLQRIQRGSDFTDGSRSSEWADSLSALSSPVIDNVVMLGGRARTPDGTVAEVGRVTGAATHRVAGDDRYATSVQAAQAFGGWFPTGAGRDHDASMVCLAASSSGSGASSIGWPDALGAGPWCAKAGGLATGVSAPVRGLPPVSGPDPLVTRGLEASHGAVRQAARAVSGQTYVVFDDQAPFADLAGTTVTSRGEIAGVAGATVEIRLVRGGAATEPDTFEAVISLSTTLGTVTATAAGEALFDPELGTWSLRGSTDVTGGTWNATDGLGGFTADLVAGEPGGADEVLTWRIDALLSPSAS